MPELHISGDMRRLLLVVLTGLYLQQQTSAQMCVLEVISKLVKQTPTIVSVLSLSFLAVNWNMFFLSLLVSRNASICTVHTESEM